MNTIIKLSWDSNFFGYSIGKFTAKELNSEKLEEIFQKMHEEKYKLVYCFVDAKDTISNRCLVEAQIDLVDEKVTYCMSLSDKKSEISKNITSYLNKQVNNHLISLALQSGEYSRFKIDNHFAQGDFERLYTTWIKNSLNGSIANDVLVYSEKGKEVGLLTLGKKDIRADIGLLAVDKKYRGRAIGTMLIQAAGVLARKLGLKQIQVVTQKNNIGACTFYEKVGFISERVENIYHIWL